MPTPTSVRLACVAALALLAAPLAAGGCSSSKAASHDEPSEAGAQDDAGVGADADAGDPDPDPTFTPAQWAALQALSPS
ncbi:MAG: hypothetical protein ABSE49_24625, partial [Polyangiaceae bacterium]